MPNINENPKTPADKPRKIEFLELYFKPLETVNPNMPVTNASPISNCFSDKSADSSLISSIYFSIIISSS